MKKSTTFNILYGLAWVAVITMVITFLSGCTAFQPKPKAPVTVQEPKAQSHRALDIPVIIQELTEAGCDILTIEAEKSNRRERMIAGCREIGD